MAVHHRQTIGEVGEPVAVLDATWVEALTGVLDFEGDAVRGTAKTDPCDCARARVLDRVLESLESAVVDSLLDLGVETSEPDCLDPHGYR